MCKIISFMLRRFIYTIVVFSAFQSAIVHAQTCSYSTGSAANLNVTLSSTLSIPRDTPIGTTVYTTGWIHPSNNVTVSCSGGGYTLGIKNSAGSQPVSGSTSFPIGTTGLSYMMFNDASSAQPAYPVAATQSAWSSTTAKNYRIDLVKTGDVNVDAGIPAQKLGAWYYGTIEGVVISLTQPIVLTQPGCTTPTVDVDMGRQKVSEFRGIGSRLAVVPFSIALTNCSTGINSVMYRLDPVTSIVTGAASVVALNATSSATGIGVQILDDSSNPLALGKNLALPSYNTKGGTATIPLNAANYQTGGKVGAGTANTSLIFTMTYQ
jgi:major type 1 subunit fimbrin (pilin)